MTITDDAIESAEDAEPLLPPPLPEEARFDANASKIDEGPYNNDEALPKDTGLKALVTIASHLGLDWSLSRLSHLYGSEGEPDVARLAAIAREEGLHSDCHSTSWSELGKFAKLTPFVARLATGGYVVVAHTPATFVRKVDGAEETAPESILIFNPRVPAAGLFPLEQSKFETFWTGEVVLFKRVFKLTDADQPFGLRWFIPEFWRQRTLFGNVILAAVAMLVLALAVPIFFQLVIDKVLVHMSISTLEVLTIGVVLAILFDSAMNWLRGYFILSASSRIDIRLARTTFRHLMSLPISFFDRALAGVVTRHMQQAGQIREFLTGRLLSTLLDLPVLIVFLPILFAYNVQLTFIVLGATVLLAAIIGLMIGPYRRRLRWLYSAEAERQSLLVESIHGMRTVKALNLEPRRQEAWDVAAASAVNNYVNVGKMSLAANALSQFIEKALSVGVVVFGAFAVFAGKMTVGELVAFNMLSSRVVGPILQIVGLLNNFQEVLMSVDMLGEVMNRPPERGRARGLTPPIVGEVEVDKVVFRYPQTESAALDSLSLRIPAGALVGIAGRSGSGKTTLSALLQGLYVATEGNVRIDGHNIRDIDLAYLRAQIGVVPQEVFLFRGTIKDNVRTGRPTATFEEVVEACRMAGAASFIEELPHRYDTVLDEGGVNLSGGQKQRLSIARALLRQPRIIIFDEATSALDPESEAIVIRNLEAIAHGRTTIIISHRLQTIRMADFIVVMDRGSAVDIGRHDDLIGRNLIYRQLWAQQTGRPS
jgi:ATP-binding cassette, subfamily B, bacterial HlyB/CyaB